MGSLLTVFRKCLRGAVTPVVLGLAGSAVVACTGSAPPADDSLLAPAATRPVPTVASLTAPVDPDLSGAAIAERRCADCHAVGDTRFQATAMGVAVPSFRDIALKPETSAASLERFMSVRHVVFVDGVTQVMPASGLMPSQRAAVIDYILSFRFGSGDAQAPRRPPQTEDRRYSPTESSDSQGEKRIPLY